MGDEVIATTPLYSDHCPPGFYIKPACSEATYMSFTDYSIVDPHLSGPDGTEPRPDL